MRLIAPIYPTTTVQCPICGNTLLALLDPPDYSVGIFGYGILELTPVTPGEDCGHIDEIFDMCDADDPRIQQMMKHLP